MSPKSLKHHLINALIWIFLLGGLAFYALRDSRLTTQYLPIFKTSPSPEAPQEVSLEEAPASLDQLPQKVELAVPFSPQAPFGNWEEPYAEACEEAALIGPRFYKLGQKELTQDKVKEEIDAMVAYQKKNYGGHHDLDAEAIQKLAQDFYGDSYELKTEYTALDIKRLLAQGHIIVVPAAGRVLENPHFKTPGPLYHALTIIGYDEKKQEFITNDPGTKRGAGFRYSYTNLLESIHDFPGEKEKILEGRKAILVFNP